MKLKQKEVAEKLKISQGFLSKIFNGRSLPSFDKAEEWKPLTGWTYAMWRKANTAQVQKLINKLESNNGKR
jgi:transcriptional regulator with XRE-family HTH domain